MEVEGCKRRFSFVWYGGNGIGWKGGWVEIFHPDPQKTILPIWEENWREIYYFDPFYYFFFGYFFKMFVLTPVNKTR